MENTLSFVKNTSLVAIGLLALFVGGGAIAVVFDALSWETLGDWTVKAVLVAVIVVAVSLVVSLVGSMFKPKEQ